MKDAASRAAVTGNQPARWLPAATWQRALTLAVGLGAAKVALVALRIADGGGGPLLDVAAPFALLHQDALLVGGFALVDLALSRARLERALWVALWSLLAYAAFNVAVARVFSTPLTVSMLGAAGGALSDSIFAYVTASNLTAMVFVLCAAIFVARRRALPSRRRVTLALSVVLALGLFGPAAAARVETLGLHRNAAVALAATGFARLAPAPRSGSVAELPPEGPALDLGHLAGAARGRNVVWVILESTAAEYLGAYGAKLDPTPNLTRLSENAVVFDAAYSAYPESIKGLWSMLCGEAPAAQSSAKDYVASRLPCASVAQSFRTAGYRTAFFHSGRFRYLGMQGIVDERGFDALFDAETIGGNHASSFGTDDASTVRRMLRFVDELPQGARFFGVYSPISGHHPYRSPGEGPRPFPAKTEKDHYLNDLFAGDAAFGELVEGLRARGLHQDTLYVIVGDHGEAFGQHEGNFAHTLHLYEENVRVPFIIAAPGLTLGRVRAPQVASLTDLRATTLALVGLHQGRSLLDPEPGVARFYTDHGPLTLGLRQGRYKAVHETEHDRTRLFDLTTDPGEQHDIAAEQPERVARYRRHLFEWSAARRHAVSTPP